MASCDKFTTDAVRAEIGHNNREHINPSNKDIDSDRTELNYSFPLNHGGLTDYQYYKKIVGESYLYGRGSSREKEAITACGWVVTLPQELQGNPAKEEAFFRGTFDFISERYGRENIINNCVHYDELGSPHIHVLFSPITQLNHDVVQYKTVKTSQATKLESGRYEYTYRFKLDENGERIKLKNYAKMSDYYDTKIDANTVLNKVELRYFHSDLQKYLQDNGIEGKVVTGKTGGVNFSVKELKEFTANTGMHLDEVKELQGDKTLLESFVDRDTKVQHLEQALHQKDLEIKALREEILSRDLTLNQLDKSAEISQKDSQIKVLSHTLYAKNQELSKATEKNIDLERKIAEMEKTIEANKAELERAKARVEELEKQKTIESSQAERTQGWGQTAASSWGDKSQSGWGTKSTSFEEEKTW